MTTSKLFNHDCYAYVAFDFNRMNDEQEHFYRKDIENRQKKKKADMEIEKYKYGYFILISSEEMEPPDVTPLYYMRQTIEQAFDFAKNDVALMPVRSHSDETFR